MQITIGRWSLATGIDWLLPKNDQEISEAKKARKEDMFVLAKQSHMSWLGLHAKTEPGSHAGALLVGLIKPNAVVLHPVSETMSWVCAIRGGMPIVGRDLVLPHDDADKTARDWFGRTDSETVLIGEQRSAVCTLTAVLTQVDEALASKAISKRQINATALQSIGFAPEKAKQLVLGVAAMALCAYGAWYFQHPEEQKASASIAASVQQQESESAKRAAEVAHADQVNKEVQARQVAELVARYSNRVSPVDFWNVVSSVRAQVAGSLYGYKSMGHNCTPTACSVPWQGQGKFVRLTDKLRLPNVEPNYSNDFSATSHFDIQVASEPLPDLKAMSPAALQLMIRSEMALHYPGAQVGEVTDKTVAPPPATGLKPIIAAHAGTWSVQFSGPTALASATSLAAALTKLPITLTAINYDKQAQSVSFVGEYAMLAKAN